MAQKQGLTHVRFPIATRNSQLMHRTSASPLTTIAYSGARAAFECAPKLKARNAREGWGAGINFSHHRLRTKTGENRVAHAAASACRCAPPSAVRQEQNRLRSPQVSGFSALPEPDEGSAMNKPRLATAWPDGCSGCHMSFLDMDERLQSWPRSSMRSTAPSTPASSSQTTWTSRWSRERWRRSTTRRRLGRSARTRRCYRNGRLRHHG